MLLEVSIWQTVAGDIRGTSYGQTYVLAHGEHEEQRVKVTPVGEVQSCATPSTNPIKPKGRSNKLFIFIPWPKNF